MLLRTEIHMKMERIEITAARGFFYPLYS
jgi:hypothetical protein